MYSIRKATYNDCLEVAFNMREADVREVYASSGTNPLTCLLRARSVSNKRCFAIYLDSHVVGIFGVAPLLKEVGVPWLLGTCDLTSNKLEFYKKSRELLNTFMDEFNILINYVDARNTTSINWLQSLGFTIGNQVSNFGYAKVPFYEFTKVKYV